MPFVAMLWRFQCIQSAAVLESASPGHTRRWVEGGACMCGLLAAAEGVHTASPSHQDSVLARLYNIVPM